MSKLREKIERGERLSGTVVSLSEPCICEILGNIGYDYAWIDMEHTYMSFKEVLCHLNAARSVGMPAIVRVPQNDLTATKKVIEMGPEGIIFPRVNNMSELKELLDMTLFPPIGTRGFGPMRAISYGADDAIEFVDSKSKEMCRFIQIESEECVDNLEEMAKSPYVDGFIFGPNDLSGSLGKVGRVYDKDVDDLIRRAVDILEKNGKYVGLAGGFDADTIKYWSNHKIKMITAGADWNFIYEQARQTFDNLQKYHIKNGK